MNEGGQPLAQETLDLDFEQDKQERLEVERVTMEKAVALAKFDTIQERVAWILNHFPDTRNSDITLQIKYWERFEPDLYDGRAIEPEHMYSLTRLTSLQRARAKIQNSYGLFQASPDVKRRRGKMSEAEKEKAVTQQPDIPTFAVYADESGKTQDHLVVGSVWFPHAEELGSLTLAIKALKRQNNFGGELHFREISSSKLTFYKQVVNLLSEQANTFSFKAVSVERRGVGNVNDALRELYYLLLCEGAKHEIKSGRATLPRKLQLIKDAEEPGSDKLLLADLKDRLSTASGSQFGGKLASDLFEAQESRSIEIIQVADLFTGSISRRLNATGDRGQPKDEFAEYFVQAVNSHLATTKDEERGDIVYHLTL